LNNSGMLSQIRSKTRATDFTDYADRARLGTGFNLCNLWLPFLFLLVFVIVVIITQRIVQAGEKTLELRRGELVVAFGKTEFGE
jgi:hypothetical protein